MIRSPERSYQLVSEPADSEEWTATTPPLSIVDELAGQIRDLVSDFNVKLAAWMHRKSEVCSVKIDDALMDLNSKVSSIKIDDPPILLQHIGIPASSIVEKSRLFQASKRRSLHRRRQLLQRRFPHLRRRIKLGFVLPALIIGGRRFVQAAIKRECKLPIYHSLFMFRLLNEKLAVRLFISKLWIGCKCFTLIDGRMIDRNLILCWIPCFIIEQWIFHENLIKNVELRECWDPGGVQFNEDFGGEGFLSIAFSGRSPIFFVLRECWDPGGQVKVLPSKSTGLFGSCLLSVFLLFVEMLVNEFSLDRFTFLFVVNACANIAELRAGEQVYAALIKMGNEIAEFLCKSLVHFYCEWRDLEAAREVFDKMAERDVVCWNAIIYGYLESGEVFRGVEMFCRMVLESFAPDSAMMSLMAQVYSCLGLFSRKKWEAASVVHGGFHGLFLVCRLSSFERLIGKFVDGQHNLRFFSECRLFDVFYKFGCCDRLRSNKLSRTCNLLVGLVFELRQGNVGGDYVGVQDGLLANIHENKIVGDQCLFDEGGDEESGRWNEEEERFLVDGHQKLGNKWSCIEKTINERIEDDVKNHWTSIIVRLIRIENSSEAIKQNFRGSQWTVLEEYINSRYEQMQREGEAVFLNASSDLTKSTYNANDHQKHAVEVPSLSEEEERNPLKELERDLLSHDFVFLDGDLIDLSNIRFFPTLISPATIASSYSSQIAGTKRPHCDQYISPIEIGDALHPMIPDIGQGACSSLEDSVALSRKYK